MTALLAIPGGLINWFDKPNKLAWEIDLYYMVLNIEAVLLWLVNFDLRTDEAFRATSMPVGSLMLSAMGLLLLLVSAYLSGLMVYDYGINVKRVLKQKLAGLPKRAARLSLQK